MPIDEHVSPFSLHPRLFAHPLRGHQNLISTDSLGQNIFACLYKGHRLFILRLLQRDGSIVNPEEAGFKMRNMTWSRDNRAYGGGDGSDIHFVLLETDRYSLLLKGKEVWTFGSPTVMGLGLSPVSAFLPFGQGLC
jgi:hypothetical protein